MSSDALHPQNRRIGTAGLALAVLSQPRRPPVLVTEDGHERHETSLCPEVRGEVLSPDEPYGDGDARAMRQFVVNGGTLLVATDFGSAGNALLTDVGASARVDGRLRRDERTYGASPAFPEATTVSNHPLTAGVDRLTLNHGSSVTTGSGNVTTLIATTPFASHDENRNDRLDDSESVGSSPVATVEPVGDGQIVVVSDPSVFINTMLETDGNSAFAANFVSTHDRLMVDVSHASNLPPLTVLLLSLRESAVPQLLLGGFVIVVITRWEEATSVAQSVLDRRGPRSDRRRRS